MNISTMNMSGKESFEVRKSLVQQAMQFYEFSIEFIKELEFNNHIYKVR